MVTANELKKEFRKGFKTGYNTKTMEILKKLEEVSDDIKKRIQLIKYNEIIHHGKKSEIDYLEVIINKLEGLK